MDASGSATDDALVRDFEFEDFAAAMGFVNRVAELAEEANHHPDILVHGWNKVRLTLTDPLRAGTLADHDSTWRDGSTQLRVGRRRYGGSRRLMNDDDSSRSSGALRAQPADRRMTVLLLLAVVVLVLLNGFFVAAEFALVRSRPSRLEEDARGRAAAGRGSRCASSTTSTGTCRPASSASRSPRWASASSASRPSPSCIEPLFGEGIPHGVSLGHLDRLAYLLVTSLHITVGEQVPKIWAIVAQSRVARRSPGRCAWFTRRCARSSRRSTRPPTGCCASSASGPRPRWRRAARRRSCRC